MRLFGSEEIGPILQIILWNNHFRPSFIFIFFFLAKEFLCKGEGFRRHRLDIRPLMKSFSQFFFFFCENEWITNGKEKVTKKHRKMFVQNENKWKTYLNLWKKPMLIKHNGCIMNRFFFVCFLMEYFIFFQICTETKKRLTRQINVFFFFYE